MRIGVDVGGTNTDAVLIDGIVVIASTKHPTTADVSSGVAAAIRTILSEASVAAEAITSVMIGTTHFTNALIERKHLDAVGILRLASPSGEALPPLTAWPAGLKKNIGENIFLLPGGYEVDGREISPFDEALVRKAVRTLRDRNINSIAISSAFAPINSEMEKRAALICHEEHPDAVVSLSHAIGKIGIIERENGIILNAALTTLAKHVMSSFEKALHDLGLDAPLYISQNDGTLISSDYAAQYPVMTIGSGPTNSMRGAAFLTGVKDAIVLDVGGTTCDIGVLANGFPRESSIAVDIGGVRTNFRMPDILAIGLGGGTRIHLAPELYNSEQIDDQDFDVGPDSVGYRISDDAFIFGGDILTASDIAVAAGHAYFGDAAGLPALSKPVITAVWNRFQSMLEEGIDRMKTSRGDTVIIAVGGGHFLIEEGIKGAAQLVRPPHASVANAVGAAIAQIGAQVEQIVDYDATPRELAIEQLRQTVTERVTAAGGMADSVEIVDMEEIFMSYLPGRSAQLRMKGVADLAHASPAQGQDSTGAMQQVHHANS